MLYKITRFLSSSFHALYSYVSFFIQTLKILNLTKHPPQSSDDRDHEYDYRRSGDSKNQISSYCVALEAFIRIRNDPVI